MTRRNLIILGDSSFAEVAYEYFSVGDTYDVKAFAVHAAFRTRANLLGCPVLEIERLAELCDPDTHDVFAALTYREMNRARARLCHEAKALGFRLASYVSPRAQVWRDTAIGENCFIFENNVVQPFVTLGNNVILWSGNHIGHHSAIEDNVFASSHVVVSGHCRIGQNSFLGVNATIADNVTIGRDNWIGPNALITKSTEPGSLWRTNSTERSKVGSLRFFQVRE
jgi:sugar O-acyltransferase (sialic acid O-acetyltransferase NeuD family)